MMSRTMMKIANAAAQAEQVAPRAVPRLDVHLGRLHQYHARIGLPCSGGRMRDDSGPHSTSLQ
jgi:hypothetical protein